LLKDKHIRFSLRQNETIISGIGFNMAEKFSLLGKPIDIVYTLDENEWNGEKSLQMKVIDVKAAE
jgi:single-stranded-DNA-specific exonuclease